MLFATVSIRNRSADNPEELICIGASILLSDIFPPWKLAQSACSYLTLSAQDPLIALRIAETLLAMICDHV